MRVSLVLGLGAVALAFGGLASATPASIQGVHGGGLRTFGGFTTKYAVNVIRTQSGSISGQIREDGGSWMVQASPSGLSAFGEHGACVTGVVTQFSGSFSGTPESIVVAIIDVAGGRDLIASAALNGPAGEPPFECAALARSLVLPPIPELTAGNFVVIGL